MSKKQIKNRLAKLFDDIKEEEKAIGKPAAQPIIKNTSPNSRKSLKRDTTPRSFERQGKVVREALDVQVDITDSHATMSLPLRMDTDIWGTLQIVDDTPERQWDIEEQMLVQQVTEQLSLALENARLFEETEKRNEELKILNEIISAASQSLDLDTSLKEVLHKTLAFMKIDGGLISLVSSETNELKLNVWEKMPKAIIKNIHQHGLEDTPCGYVQKTENPLVLKDIHNEKSPISISALLANGISSYLGIPLVTRDKTLGTLCMFHSKTLTVAPEDITLLSSIGKQVGSAIETARLFTESQEKSEELALINKIVIDVSSSLDMQKNLLIIAKEIAKLSDAPRVGIMLLNKAKTDLVLVADYPKTPADFGMKIALEGNPSSVKVLETLQPLSIPNVLTNPLTTSITDVMKARGTGSLVIFPLLAANEAIGTLGIGFDEPETLLSPNKISLIQTILLQASTSIETARFFEKTKESESEFRSLFAAMDDVIFIVDKDTRYLRIAPTKTDGLYRLPDELLGQRMDEIMPEEDRPFFRDAIHKTLASEETINIEYPLEIGGKTAWFDANLSKLAEDQVYWVARDVTERKQAELQIQRLGNAVEQSLDGMAIASMDGNIEFINPAWAKMHGYATTAELIGQSLTIFHSEEQLQSEVAPFNEIVSTEGSNQGEIGRKRQDGSIFPAWMTVGILRSIDDIPLALVASAQDITERKKSESILKRQNEYMAAAAEVGRLVTSTLDTSILFKRAVTLLQEHFGYYHVAIFVREEAGFDVVIREATGDAGKEMKEQKHSLIIGSKSVVGTATGTGKPYILNNVLDAPLHHNNPLLPDTKAEAAIPLKTGRRVIGALDLQANQAGAFTKEDIEVLQILADQFATAIDNARSYQLAQEAFLEMRELEKLKSQFLANMSHELRTPLNSIIGFSRVILKGIDGPITDLQQEDLSAIYNSGQHLLGLINDILDLSKIEAGKMELTYDEVDIEKLIKSVMSTAMGLIKDKPVRLEEKIEPNLPPVKADSIRVRQILINLFSNAAKFTDEGTIKVVALRKENMVHISVIDSGPGISAEDQEKLFQAFSQVDASATRATGGSGLGLSISKQLVTMHEGEIGLHSEIGKGSTFYFTLPFFDTPETVPEPEETIKETKPNLDDLIILAIDDDEKVIRLYERYLNAQGYRVIPLTDPKKAVEKAKELKPYAITLDIMMPGCDGWQVLEDLKSDPETQIFPTVICSIVEDSEKGYALGAADYLLKPIIEDDLLGSLGRINKSGEIHEVLIIDDKESDRRLLEKMLLENKKYKPILADGGLAGWEKLLSISPQAVILDLFMPEMDGFEIVDAMQTSEKLKNIPVIIISGGDISNTQQEKLDSLNHHLLEKGELTPEDLLSTLERSLNHFKN